MLFIIGLLLGAGTIVFILQNTAVVTVTFFAWQTEGSLALVLLLTALVAIVITMLFSVPEIMRSASLKRDNKRLREDLEAHKQKLSQTEAKLFKIDRGVVVEKTTMVDTEVK